MRVLSVILEKRNKKGVKTVQTRNICKFITQDVSGQLLPQRFILESDRQVMTMTVTNPANRMVLVTKNAGKWKLDNQETPCRAGDIIFFFQHETYSFEGEKDFQYMYIDFTGLRAEELFRKFGITKLRRRFAGFDGLIPLWMESLSRASDENVDLVAESMLLYTFSKFTAGDTKTNGWVNKVLEITENEFADPTLSVTTVAARLGYNAKYLSNVFKKTTGVGYTEYLQTCRIRYAVSLFENGLDSIKNVAILSGFTDPLYFSTVFKKYIGTAPKDHIKNLFGR